MIDWTDGCLDVGELAANIIDIAAKVSPPSSRDWSKSLRAQLPVLLAGAWLSAVRNDKSLP